MSNPELYDQGIEGIAIVGMAGRFPGAASIDEFWRNLQNGVEAVSFFTADELLAAGIDAQLLNDPHYVKARAILEGVELFDARFFGFSARETEIMDPQHRLFLECAWEAFEHAGYDTARYDGRVGVFAGASISSYLLNLYSHPRIIEAVGGYQALLANDKDHLTMRVSYKLNLRGPSFSVQTTCSTSLVAVSIACQSLLTYQCDMALAGGATISLPQISGYLYQEDGIFSPDGHCRAFDARARGTIGGNGVGAVLLKRLSDAVADGDYIYAVIKGSAINNDGAMKVGYTAPSVKGQAEVIAEALSIAGVAPETISYVEAHGTGTPLGDPIEIAALTQAFGARAASGACAIGSVKTNIGHLDAASGVAGLIKTVLALEHKLLPPSLYFEDPNPKIDFANSPFRVNTTLAPWTTDGAPRRAGVSSFGIGGTNAHVILEEAPPTPAPAASRPWQALTLSAATATALETMTGNLARYLRERPALNLADAAYTLQVGRRILAHRRVIVCRDVDQAVHALETLDPQYVFSAFQERDDRPVALLLPGQGTQHAGMGAALYQHEPTFRALVDRCARLLRPHLGLDIRALLYPDLKLEDGRSRSEESRSVTLDSGSSIRDLEQTWLAQPALFVIEYALARLWMEWGVRPTALHGHSIGEYVAACLAGVFSLEDALTLVAARGRLMQSLPPGAMLSVPLAEAEVQPLLGADLSIAANNGPSLCVVSGPSEAIARLEIRLSAQGVEARRLHTSHAFHSSMMEPIVDAFAAEVRKVALKPPQIRYLSNLTGDWITAAEATDPEYWAQHMRRTVRFAEGMRMILLDLAECILFEVGPGQTLSALARQQGAGMVMLASLPQQRETRAADDLSVARALGKLWLSGVRVDWPGYYAHERRRRIPLPTYPFERQRYWIEARTPTRMVGAGRAEAIDENDNNSDNRDEALASHPRPDLLTAYAPPRTDIEQIIAAVWQESLGVAQVGVYDPFVELGGHSLLATQITFRLREIFPVELGLDQFFRADTVAQLAEVIEGLLLDELDKLSDDEAERLV